MPAVALQSGETTMSKAIVTVAKGTAVTTATLFVAAVTTIALGAISPKAA